MNQNSFAAITALINAFPQSAADSRALLLTFDRALTAVSDPAINEAVDRFIVGDVQGQSKTFAPSVAEFVTEARKRQEYLDLKSRPRLPAPRYFPGPVAPFQVRQEKARTKYRNCPILQENVSYDQFRMLSQKQEIPAGAVWVATLATIFGPPAADIAEGRRDA